MKRNIKNTINQQVRDARRAYRAEDAANGEYFTRDVSTGGTVVVDSRLLKEKSWTNKHPQVVDYDAAAEARKAHKNAYAQWAPPSPGDLVMWYRYPWNWNKSASRLSSTQDNEPTIALVVNVVESTTSRPVVTLMVDGQTLRTTIEHIRTMDMFE